MAKFTVIMHGEETYQGKDSFLIEALAAIMMCVVERGIEEDIVALSKNMRELESGCIITAALRELEI